MKTWIITCTGDRPEALRLCNHYMQRQTYQDFEWIVVDDGPTGYKPNRADQYLVSAPQPGKITLVKNLKTALGWVDTQYADPAHTIKQEGIILFVEDDDWYSGAYIGIMHNIAANLPANTMLFGESFTRYYNVRWRTYRHNDNDKWASLCSMGMRTQFLPQMAEILDQADPDRPFVDVTAFQKYDSRAYLQPTDLVCGIKGMPGRKGIGHGHTEPCKRLRRDPYLEVLRDWIGPDVERYRDYYHDEEMKDVPIHPEDRQQPWVMQELKKKDEGKSGICVLFRLAGAAPDTGAFAAGAFTHGYLNEIRDIIDAKVGHFPQADLAVVSGGFLRHGGLNGVVHAHYRALGVPVVILDPGRIIKDTQRIYINDEHWIPPIKCPRDRMELLGLDYVPKPRGENILVVGQRPDLDNQLKPALTAMNAASNRQIIYRPHPNMYHPHQRNEYDVPFDKLSIGGDKIDSHSKQTLEDDLDRAWCVVTHSSIVGVNALLRGIPVMCHKDAAFSAVGFPLSWAEDVEGFDRPGWPHMDTFLRKWSYSVWFEREIRSGKAMAFLKQFIKKETP